MLRDRRAPLLLSLLCLLLIAPGLPAQTTISYDDQLNLLAPTYNGETGLFKTITGDTLRRGDWSFGVYWNNFDYLAAPPTPDLVIPSRRHDLYMDLEEDRFSASLGYGLTDRWEFTAMLPYVRLDQNAGDLSGYLNGYPYRGKFSENGIGNLHLATKFALLDPTVYASRFAISLFADAPTGDDKGGIATGNADYGAGVQWGYRVFNLSGIYKIVGKRNADKTPLGVDVNLPDEAQLDAGLNIPLRFWSTTNWITEVNTVFYQGGDEFATPDDIVYLLTGLRHWFGTSGWALSAAVRGNVTMATSDHSNACPYGGLVGLTYAPMHLAPPPPPPAVIPPPPPPPPPPAPVAPPPAPVAPPPQPQELRTDEIHFESGSARLTNIAKAILDDVALRMKQEPASTAVVIGYTDDRENTGPNADLDRRRAEAVRDYLVSRHGIDPSRIRIEARGTQDAIGDNTTAEGRLKNRRVVIRLIIP